MGLFRTLISVVLALAPTLGMAQNDARMIERGRPYFATISDSLDRLGWHDMPYPSFIAAQIEKESLWNPKAELKTSREYGFGFGQFTITSRFNAFEEVKAMHRDLRDWKYEDRFDPARQIFAISVRDRNHYRQCTPLMADDYNAFACIAASYNGGHGGFISDRRICANTKGCDPRVWFKNVENTSMKQRSKVAGYGNSFFDINRAYVLDLMERRRAKYIPYFGR